MISIVRLAAVEGIEDAAVRALQVLAARPGYVRGSAGRATDDPQLWVLVTEWRDVGSYRRALGAYEVKIGAQPLLAQAIDEANAFEELVVAEPGATPVRHNSDRALDTLA